MLKKILCMLSFFLILPVQAGEFENAIEKNEKVFLYLYTKNCSYCVKFNPIYEKLLKNYGNSCKFVKIDASTEYGLTLMRRFEAYFVPYVLMVDSKTRAGKALVPNCFMSYACSKNVIEKFIN